MALHHAREQGLRVMLKPQIWLRGSWPGDIRMNDDAEWARFFAAYEAWILHYALLAEMYQADMLCLGVELRYATLGHEGYWREIIRRIRKLYAGPLVYAANWGEEFEGITFWDELDYIGIDCYYPLSSKTEAGRAELLGNFREVLERIEAVSEAYKKPVIFTEIGFRSVEAPWQQPHAEAGDRRPDLAAQALCYEIVGEGLAEENWVTGIFWWKWPSFLEYREMEDSRRFSPQGKPAEKVVARWFGQWKNR
jgi:hypothetical protein